MAEDIPLNNTGQAGEAINDSVEQKSDAEKKAPVEGGKQAETKKVEEESQEMTTLHERTIAALSYVSFLAVVPFYLKKDSKFCRFHGKQGLLIAIIFFLAKLLLVIDLLMDVALFAQFGIFVWMGFSALGGKWKKMPWIYAKSCQLEDQLSLKTKDEEANEEALKPNEVGNEEPDTEEIKKSESEK